MLNDLFYWSQKQPPIYLYIVCDVSSLFLIYFSYYSIYGGSCLINYLPNNVLIADLFVFNFGVLQLVSLFLDGITGGVQDKLRAEHRSPTHCMMLWMNVWSVIYLGVGKFYCQNVSYAGQLDEYVRVCACVNEKVMLLKKKFHTLSFF